MGVFDWITTENASTIRDPFKVARRGDSDEVLRSILERPEGTMRLWPKQLEALTEIHRTRGLNGLLDVGEGKTLVGWLAVRVLGAPALICVPASLKSEFWKEVAKYKEHFNGPPDEHITLLSYSKLSSHKSANILEELAPRIIICDETHTLNGDSTRARRFTSYMRAYPTTIFIWMSATAMGDTVGLARLSQFAHGEQSPLPDLNSHLLTSWARVLDKDGEPSVTDLRLFGVNTKRQACARFYKHFSEARGVVCTQTEPNLIPLRLEYLDLPVPARIHETIMAIREAGETPWEEEVIVDEEQLWSIEKNLSAGFFYKWDWEAVGGYDEEWMLARKTWNRILRSELDGEHRPGYDSRFLITNSTIRDLNRDPTLAQSSEVHWAWVQWASIKDRVSPPSVVVWVDDFLLKDVEARGRGIHWFNSSRAFEHTLPFRTFVGGSESPESYAPARVGASISTHGTGKNLQGWHEATVIEPPSKANIWHQMLGRLHRNGQTREVTFFVYQHTEAYRRALNSAIEEAKWLQNLNPLAPQRLCQALNIIPSDPARQKTSSQIFLGRLAANITT